MAPMEPLLPLSRETKIRRDASGRWFDGDAPIDHEGIERAFDRWIDRAEDGRYILKNSVNWAYVSVEGAPLFVRRVALDPLGATLSLSDGREERLDPRTLREGPDGRLYATARGGRLAAAFDRAAAMDLWAAVVGEGELELGGERFTAPRVEDPLR